MTPTPRILDICFSLLEPAYLTLGRHGSRVLAGWWIRSGRRVDRPCRAELPDLDHRVRGIERLGKFHTAGSGHGNQYGRHRSLSAIPLTILFRIGKPVDQKLPDESKSLCGSC